MEYQSQHAATARHFLYQIIPSLHQVLGWFSFNLASLYAFLVIDPFRRLYRQGPAFHGIGFWRNAPSSDICASLAPLVDSAHWKSTPAGVAECERMIEKDFLSIVVLLETLLYFFVLYRLYFLLATACGVVTRRALKKGGWIERSSPEMLHLLHRRMPFTERYYYYYHRERGGDGKEDTYKELREKENSTSPYHAYKRQ